MTRKDEDADEEDGDGVEATGCGAEEKESKERAGEAEADREAGARAEVGAEDSVRSTASARQHAWPMPSACREEDEAAAAAEAAHVCREDVSTQHGTQSREEHRIEWTTRKKQNEETQWRQSKARTVAMTCGNTDCAAKQKSRAGKRGGRQGARKSGSKVATDLQCGEDELSEERQCCSEGGQWVQGEECQNLSTHGAARSKRQRKREQR